MSFQFLVPFTSHNPIISYPTVLMINGPRMTSKQKKISIHLVPINHNRSNGADNPILLTSSQIYQFSQATFIMSPMLITFFLILGYFENSCFSSKIFILRLPIIFLKVLTVCQCTVTKQTGFLPTMRRPQSHVLAIRYKSHRFVF